jgi:hypothetical protein
VRAGCGLVRVVLTRPRRRVVLVTVRGGAVAAVTAEHREGRALAAQFAASLEGHRLDASLDPAGMAPEMDAALRTARRVLG